MPVQRYTGPGLIIASVFFLGFAIYLFTTGALKMTSDHKISGMIEGYSYKNHTCIICQTVFHGYPNCKEYSYSGAVRLNYQVNSKNCTSILPVNVCGATPEQAEQHTEELYKIDSMLEGYYAKGCDFHFFRSNGWESVGLGIAFFSVFLVLLSLGIYFTTKYNQQNRYQQLMN
jgi:hypothetical protein